MKNLLLVILIAITTPSLAQKKRKSKDPISNFYKYTYILEKPTQDSSLHYQDENLDIKFSFGDSWIRFVLKNQLEAPIKINWDDASIVQKGKSKRIINSNTDYSKKTQPQPSTTIPPTASLDISVIPEENIYFGVSYTNLYDNAQKWRQKSLLVSNDLGNAEFGQRLYEYIGESVSFYLPAIIKGTQKDYFFSFKVVSVTKTPIE